MKIDRKKIYNRCGFDQRECYDLAVRLATLSDEQLISEIQKIKVWHYGKCELGLWADVLDRLDSILSDAVEKVGVWTMKLDVDGNESLVKQVITILEFTGHLIEHSIYRYLYGSWEHILALFGTSNMDILLALLGLFYNFSKRSNYFSRLDNDNRRIVIERLDSIAENWGGKQHGFGLAECCNINYIPPTAGSMQFEFTQEISSINTATGNTNVLINSSSSYCIGSLSSSMPPPPPQLPLNSQLSSSQQQQHCRRKLTLKNLHSSQHESPSQLMESLIIKHNIHNLSDQMALFARLRLCVYFCKPELRQKLIYTRMQALSILCYTNEVEDKWDIIEELVDVLKLADRQFLRIKACALRTLTAIIHCGKLVSCWQLLRNLTQMNNYNGHFPTIMRQWIDDLVNNKFNPYAGSDEQQFTTAILSFLYHLACTNEIPNNQDNLVTTGLLDSMKCIINWHTSHTDYISYATRAVRVTDQILLSFNVNINSVAQQDTINSLVQRLRYEVELCISYSNAYGMNVDSSSCANAALNTQRVGFIKSMLNLIKRLIHDQEWNETLANQMCGDLPEILRLIFTNYHNTFNAQLCLFSMEVITNYVYNQPSAISSIQQRNFTKDMLSTLTEHSLPVNRDFLVTLPSLLSALAINDQGISEIRDSGIIYTYVNTLTDSRYVSAMRNKRIREMMVPTDTNSVATSTTSTSFVNMSASNALSNTTTGGGGGGHPTSHQMSNAMNELIRSNPNVFRPIIYDAIIQNLKRITEIGRSQPAPLLTNRTSTSNNQVLSDDGLYLMDYMSNVCKFLERFLADFSQQPQHGSTLDNGSASFRSRLYSEEGLTAIISIITESSRGLPYDIIIANNASTAGLTSNTNSSNSALLTCLPKIFEYLLAGTSASTRADAQRIFHILNQAVEHLGSRITQKFEQSNFQPPHNYSIILKDYVTLSCQYYTSPTSITSNDCQSPVASLSDDSTSVCLLHDLVVLSCLVYIYEKITDRVASNLRQDILHKLNQGVVYYTKLLPYLNWETVILKNLFFEDEEACLEDLRRLCISEASNVQSTPLYDASALPLLQSTLDNNNSTSPTTSVTNSNIRALSSCQQLFQENPRSEKIVRRMIQLIQKVSCDLVNVMVALIKFCCVKPDYNCIVRVRYNRPNNPPGTSIGATNNSGGGINGVGSTSSSGLNYVPSGQHKLQLLNHVANYYKHQLSWNLSQSIKYLHPIKKDCFTTLLRILQGVDQPPRSFLGFYYAFQINRGLHAFFLCGNNLIESIQSINYMETPSNSERSIKVMLENFLDCADKLCQVKRLRQELSESHDREIKDRFDVDLYEQQIRSYMLQPISRVFALSSSSSNITKYDLLTAHSQEALMNIIAFLTTYIFDSSTISSNNTKPESNTSIDQNLSNIGEEGHPTVDTESINTISSMDFNEPEGSMASIGAEGSNINPSREHNIEFIEELGFPRSVALNALQINNWDATQAVTMLFNSSHRSLHIGSTNTSGMRVSGNQYCSRIGESASAIDNGSNSLTEHYRQETLSELAELESSHNSRIKSEMRKSFHINLFCLHRDKSIDIITRIVDILLLTGQIEEFLGQILVEDGCRHLYVLEDNPELTESNQKWVNIEHSANGLHILTLLYNKMRCEVTLAFTKYGMLARLIDMICVLVTKLNIIDDPTEINTTQAHLTQLMLLINQYERCWRAMKLRHELTQLYNSGSSPPTWMWINERHGLWHKLNYGDAIHRSYRQGQLLSHNSTGSYQYNFVTLIQKNVETQFEYPIMLLPPAQPSDSDKQTSILSDMTQYEEILNETIASYPDDYPLTPERINHLLQDGLIPLITRLTNSSTSYNVLWSCIQALMCLVIRLRHNYPNLVQLNVEVILPMLGTVTLRSNELSFATTGQLMLGYVTTMLRQLYETPELLRHSMGTTIDKSITRGAYIMNKHLKSNSHDKVLRDLFYFIWDLVPLLSRDYSITTDLLRNKLRLESPHSTSITKTNKDPTPAEMSPQSGDTSSHNSILQYLIDVMLSLVSYDQWVDLPRQLSRHITCSDAMSKFCLIHNCSDPLNTTTSSQHLIYLNHLPLSHIMSILLELTLSYPSAAQYLRHVRLYNRSLIYYLVNIAVVSTTSSASIYELSHTINCPAPSLCATHMLLALAIQCKDSHEDIIHEINRQLYSLSSSVSDNISNSSYSSRRSQDVVKLLYDVIQRSPPAVSKKLVLLSYRAKLPATLTRLITTLDCVSTPQEQHKATINEILTTLDCLMRPDRQQFVAKKHTRSGTNKTKTHNRTIGNDQSSIAASTAPQSESRDATNVLAMEVDPPQDVHTSERFSNVNFGADESARIEEVATTNTQASSSGSIFYVDINAWSRRHNQQQISSEMIIPTDTDEEEDRRLDQELLMDVAVDNGPGGAGGVINNSGELMLLEDDEDDEEEEEEEDEVEEDYDDDDDEDNGVIRDNSRNAVDASNVMFRQVEVGDDEDEDEEIMDHEIVDDDQDDVTLEQIFDDRRANTSINNNNSSIQNRHSRLHARNLRGHARLTRISRRRNRTTIEHQTVVESAPGDAIASSEDGVLRSALVTTGATTESETDYEDVDDVDDDDDDEDDDDIEDEDEDDDEEEEREEEDDDDAVDHDDEDEGGSTGSREVDNNDLLPSTSGPAISIFNSSNASTGNSQIMSSNRHHHLHHINSSTNNPSSAALASTSATSSISQHPQTNTFRIYDNLYFVTSSMTSGPSNGATNAVTNNFLSTTRPSVVAATSSQSSSSASQFHHQPVTITNNNTQDNPTRCVPGDIAGHQSIATYSPHLQISNTSAILDSNNATTNNTNTSLNANSSSNAANHLSDVLMWRYRFTSLDNSPITPAPTITTSNQTTTLDCQQADQQIIDLLQRSSEALPPLWINISNSGTASTNTNYTNLRRWLNYAGQLYGYELSDIVMLARFQLYRALVATPSNNQQQNEAVVPVSTEPFNHSAPVTTPTATAVATPSPATEELSMEQMIAEGIDPSFVEALPPSMRQEVIAEHRRANRVRQELSTAQLPESVDASIMAELPANIQEEILYQYRQTTPATTTANNTSSHGEGDGAAATAMSDNAGDFLVNLPENLRREILLDMDASQIANLTGEVAEEAHRLHAFPYRGGAAANSSSLASNRRRVRQVTSGLTSLLNQMQQQGRSHYRYVVFSEHTPPPPAAVTTAANGLLAASTRNYPPSSLDKNVPVFLSNQHLTILVSMAMICATTSNNIYKQTTQSMNRIITNVCCHVSSRQWIIRTLISLINELSSSNLISISTNVNDTSAPNCLMDDIDSTSPMIGAGNNSPPAISESSLANTPTNGSCCDLSNTGHHQLLCNDQTTNRSIFLMTFECGLAVTDQIFKFPPSDSCPVHPSIRQNVSRALLDTLAMLATAFPSDFYPTTTSSESHNNETIPTDFWQHLSTFYHYKYQISLDQPIHTTNKRQQSDFSTTSGADYFSQLVQLINLHKLRNNPPMLEKCLQVIYNIIKAFHKISNRNVNPVATSDTRSNITVDSRQDTATAPPSQSNHHSVPVVDDSSTHFVNPNLSVNQQLPQDTVPDTSLSSPLLSSPPNAQESITTSGSSVQTITIHPVSSTTLDNLINIITSSSTNASSSSSSTASPVIFTATDKSRQLAEKLIVELCKSNKCQTMPEVVNLLLQRCDQLMDQELQHLSRRLPPNPLSSLPSTSSASSAQHVSPSVSGDLIIDQVPHHSHLLDLLRILRNLNYTHNQHTHQHQLWSVLDTILANIKDPSVNTDQLTYLQSYIECYLLVHDHASINSFVERHRTFINQLLRQIANTVTTGSSSSANTSIDSTNFAVLVKHHHRLLDFDIKRRYFSSKINQLRSQSDHLHHHHSRYDEELIQVSRHRLFEDSYGRLHRKTPEEWKQRFSIKFINEEGQDGGGLLREWYLKMSHEIFNPDYVLFKVTPDGVTYAINPASSVNSNHLSYFHFVGRFLAKAIFDGKLLQCYFTRALYKHILGLPVRYQDLEKEDPELYRGLQYLLDNTVDDLQLEQTFTVQMSEFGRCYMQELVPDGAQIHVTDENKHNYVSRMSHQRMTQAVKPQLDSLLRGFYDIIPANLISIFTESELELLICGLHDIDLADLRANTIYNKYSSTDSQIQWFWQALDSFHQEDRAKFLQFVTGTSKVPLGGFAKLEGMNGPTKFQISLASSSSTNHLPAAHTCFNSLDLPPYESYDKLRSRLLTAVRECCEGYGMI